MKKDIHPKYKELKLKIGNDVFYTRSTYKQNELLVDIDFRKHPAWTKKGMGSLSATSKNVTSFNQKFAGLDFGIKKS